MARAHQSPNLDMLGDPSNESGEVKSYFERNNLKSPRLVSRAERLHKRQRQQEDTKADEVLEPLHFLSSLPEAWVDETEETLFDDTSTEPTSSKTQPPMADTEEESDLDRIVQQAKLGIDYPTLLREDLLYDSYYDKHAYPWSYA